jgi:DNA-binding NarL/FixJ family response regulator
MPVSDKRIRILTVDDHPLLREGIAALVEGQPDMELVGEAANGLEAIECYRECHPDITLMDLDTIRAVHSGSKRVHPEVAADIASHLGSDVLSHREIDVLIAIAAGKSNKTVASTLGIGEETVKMHVKAILAKLGANDRTHAVTLALKRGIIHL